MAYNYLVYRWKSVDEHGVHSPFVFALLNEVIYNRADFYRYEEIEGLRQELLVSDKKLECTDLGAGSLKGSSTRRKVSDIARNAAKPSKYAQLLFRMVNHFRPAQVLELGTSLGISTAYLASANSGSQVTTIEGCAAVSSFAAGNFKKLDLHNIRQITGNFDDRLAELLSQIPSLDLVFFDGNHRKAPTLEYFRLCLEKAHEGSVFIFDDINWSEEMRQAWNEIKAHERVTVTIDLFFMGIVFFRREQAKQHFLIKF